jgi:hypothetical protein
MSSPIISSQDYAAYQSYISRTIAVLEKIELMREREYSPITEEILDIHFELLKLMSGVLGKTAMKGKREQLKYYGWFVLRAFLCQLSAYKAIKFLRRHGFMMWLDACF